MTDLLTILQPILSTVKDLQDREKKVARTATGWRKDKAEKNVVRLGKVINNLLELVRNEQKN